MLSIDRESALSEFRVKHRPLRLQSDGQPYAFQYAKGTDYSRTSGPWYNVTQVFLANPDFASDGYAKLKLKYSLL
eukprot:tig00000654_g2816.t1